MVSPMRLRCALIGVGVALLVGLATTSISSARVPLFTVSAAKEANGDYVEGTQQGTIGEGKTKLFFWRVQSNGGGVQSMVFDDAATGDSDEGYKIKWYKGLKPKPSKNISSDVESAGFEFSLKQFKHKFFTAEVTRKPGSGTLCLGGQARNDPMTYSQAAYFDVNGVCT